MAYHILIDIALNASSLTELHASPQSARRCSRHVSFAGREFQILPDVLAFFGNDKKLQEVLFRIEQSPSQNIPCDDFAFDSVAVAQIPPSSVSRYFITRICGSELLIRVKQSFFSNR
jgi:hypothetical protein